MRCHHYCNEPLHCPECVKRFWKWAEMHTRGRPPKSTADVPFYEAATRWKVGGNGAQPVSKTGPR